MLQRDQHNTSSVAGIYAVGIWRRVGGWAGGRTGVDVHVHV